MTPIFRIIIGPLLVLLLVFWGKASAAEPVDHDKLTNVLEYRLLMLYASRHDEPYNTSSRWERINDNTVRYTINVAEINSICLVQEGLVKSSVGDFKFKVDERTGKALEFILRVDAIEVHCKIRG